MTFFLSTNLLHRDGFTQLIKALREQLSKRGLGLAASVSGFRSIIDQGYNFPAMWNDLDMINVMTYDYHGFWDGKTGHHSPLYAVGKTDEDGGEFEYYNTVRARYANIEFIM